MPERTIPVSAARAIIEAWQRKRALLRERADLHERIGAINAELRTLRAKPLAEKHGTDVQTIIDLVNGRRRVR